MPVAIFFLLSGFGFIGTSYYLYRKHKKDHSGYHNYRKEEACHALFWGGWGCLAIASLVLTFFL